MNKNDVLALLASHQPADDKEAADTRQVVEFVQSTACFWQRSTPQGHVTASAWIIDEAMDQALLTHHKKLDRWLQLGGHVDGDASLLEAALREAREESGLTAIAPASEEIFDVDVHLIPARKNEPAHLHYDIRFLLVADAFHGLQVSDESNALRWIPLHQLPRLVDEPSILRMMHKTWALDAA